MTSPLRIAGTLYPFAETGTEGVVWAITYPGLPGYDNLVCLGNGDTLRIYGEGGVIDWEGVIDLEFERRRKPYPGNPELSQQEIHGMWVHGFQSNRTPEAWSDAFFKNAPAVAFIAPHNWPQDPVRLQEQSAITQLLDELPEAPEAAWRALEQKQPALVARVRPLLTRSRSRLAEEMRWPKPEVTPGPEGDAQNLLHLLALERAMRAHWAPRYPSDQQKAARALFPQPLDDALAQQWAKTQLPFDATPLPA